MDTKMMMEVSQQEQPHLMLMVEEGLPDLIATEFQAAIEKLDYDVTVVRKPRGPFAGVEWLMPTAIGLYVTARFFDGFIQEAGKDTYTAFKHSALSLWWHSKKLRIMPVGSAGKVSRTQAYSLAFSITGQITAGLRFKFMVQSDVGPESAETGINAFLELITDLLAHQIPESDLNALLTYKPVGGIVLVTFDADKRKIVPVDPFEGHLPE
jgi:hypothetical protein